MESKPTPTPDGQSAALEAVVQRLTREHDEVKDMFRAYKKLMDYDGSGSAREDLAARICNALTVHADFEEQFFYPAAREALPEDSEECLDHAEVEHASIKRLIEEIESGDPDDPLYDAKVHVLGEYVAHHVCEEEDEMFSELRQEGTQLEKAMKGLADQETRWNAYVSTDEKQAKKAPDGKRAKASKDLQPEKKSASSSATPNRQRVSRGAARKTVTASGSKKKKAASTK